ncbi:hypothetical protein IQ274_27580 [Nostoc sp. LEGE 12447]|uniref:hypothetical protein n=1 Tax=Nostoc sp. LEGE 12447 TaxID=1828640 RepID=UPI001883474A|nr:hypothetical protein [Nostoc sp. LEGE 12447]MBE9001864.1 hypothetical protein [Nostoc sp. LEGE 12447]
MKPQNANINSLNSTDKTLQLSQPIMKILKASTLILPLLITTANLNESLAQSHRNISSKSTSISKTIAKQNLSNNSPTSHLISQSERKQNLNNQKGRLRFVNDTPYTGIVLLYRPGDGKQQPNRYAYIPPCHSRELAATYSGYWKVSFNGTEPVAIGDVSEKEKNGIFFEIELSSLKRNNELIKNCLSGKFISPDPVYDPEKTENPREKIFKNLIQQLEIAKKPNQDNLEKIKALDDAGKNISILEKSHMDEILTVHFNKWEDVFEKAATIDLKNPKQITEFNIFLTENGLRNVTKQTIESMQKLWGLKKQWFTRLGKTKEAYIAKEISQSSLWNRLKLLGSWM